MKETGRSMDITQAMSHLDSVQNGIKSGETQGEEALSRPHRKNRDAIGAWGRLQEGPRMTNAESDALQAKLEATRPTVEAVIVDVAAMEQADMTNQTAPTKENHVTW